MPRVVSTHFDVFEPASLSDVKKIALASATKSCELNPLPTSLVKHHIDPLSPLLARIINASLSSTVFRHHLYADNTQLYITFPPTDHTQALARREVCVQDAKAWLCDNGLVMNDNKSQAIVIRSSSLRTPTSLTRVNICGQLVDTSPVIRDQGFTIDINLTMTSQVANICRYAYYNLSRIAKIRDSISTTVCKRESHTRTGDIANRLWHCGTIRHQRSSLAPSGNGSAVCSSNCRANPAGRPAVRDNNTAAITLAACQKAYRIQASNTRAQGFTRWHARVPRGTATPAST